MVILRISLRKMLYRTGPSFSQTFSDILDQTLKSSPSLLIAGLSQTVWRLHDPFAFTTTHEDITVMLALYIIRKYSRESTLAVWALVITLGMGIPLEKVFVQTAYIRNY